LLEEAHKLWDKVNPDFDDWWLYNGYNAHFFTAEYFAGVINHTGTLYANDKVAYLADIKMMLEQLFPYPNQLKDMITELPIANILWLITYMFPQFTDYANKLYIERDLKGFLETVTFHNPKQADESLRLKNAEIIRKYLDDYAPKNWITEFSQSNPELLLKTIKIFYPEIKQDKNQIQTAGFSFPGMGKIAAVGAIGIFGLFVISKIGNK
jgi:hypothetical protein